MEFKTGEIRIAETKRRRKEERKEKEKEKQDNGYKESSGRMGNLE